MYYGNRGGYCEPVEYTKKDKEAILKEQEAILEAKLATVRHMIENLDSEDDESDDKKYLK